MRDDASRRPVQGHHPVFGLESLDRMGIDIDQDPRAFAQFLELRKLAGRHRPPRGRRGRLHRPLNALDCYALAPYALD